MKDVNKIYLTWYDFEEAASSIADKYRDQGLTKIIGISRGGLPLAVKMSNLLDIPMIPIIWQTRDGDIKEVDKLVELRGEVEHILFIDDICDSGKTIEEIKKIIPTSRWVTWVEKKPNIVERSVIPLNEDYSDWIVFPWE